MKSRGLETLRKWIAIALLKSFHWQIFTGLLITSAAWSPGYGDEDHTRREPSETSSRAQGAASRREQWQETLSKVSGQWEAFAPAGVKADLKLDYKVVSIATHSRWSEIDGFDFLLSPSMDFVKGDSSYSVSILKGESPVIVISMDNRKQGMSDFLAFKKVGNPQPTVSALPDLEWRVALMGFSGDWISESGDPKLEMRIRYRSIAFKGNGLWKDVEGRDFLLGETFQFMSNDFQYDLSYREEDPDGLVVFRENSENKKLEGLRFIRKSTP